VGDNEIGDDKNEGESLAILDCHGDAAVRRGAHHPIEHVQGFTGSRWMALSGECLRRIAPAATMVNEFVITTQNTTKTQLLASNYGTF
jgi:streptogramin lyase